MWLQHPYYTRTQYHGWWIIEVLRCVVAVVFASRDVARLENGTVSGKLTNSSGLRFSWDNTIFPSFAGTLSKSMKLILLNNNPAWLANMCLQTQAEQWTIMHAATQRSAIYADWLSPWEASIGCGHNVRVRQIYARNPHNSTSCTAMVVSVVKANT